MLAEIERISRAMDASGFTLRAARHRRQVHRRHARGAAGGAAALPEHAADAVPPQRRLGHRPPDRHPRGARRDRRLDRRRHDVPERADPRVRRSTCSTTRTSTRSSGPGPPSRARTSSCGCRPSGSSARSPSGWPRPRSRTSTPGCARSAGTCRCPTCGCCRPGSPASRRSRCRSCPTSTRSTTCRSTTPSAPAPRSSTSSRTPTATSCRCCGWSCTSTRSRS